MTGRQVIIVKESLSLDELYRFMQANWNTESHNGFVKGRPTPASIEEYICLPATEHYMVIAYARKAGGLFSKENKVILCVCDTPEGIKQQIFSSLPTHNVLFGIEKIKRINTKEKERKGPAEEALLFYTKYMRELLKQHSLC